MTKRNGWAWVLLLAALGTGCGGGDGGEGTDGGLDGASEGGLDASMDAPSDASASDASDPDSSLPDADTDAGPLGCTEGCGAVEVAAGMLHTCARRENGEVLCWGGNFYRQLGDRRRGHGNDCARGSTGEREDCTPEPVRVALPGPASALFSSGGFATCALLDAESPARVLCWGLSPEQEASRMANILREAPEAIEAFDGAVWATTNGFTECAVTESEARCWGINSRGQLGLGDGDFMWRNVVAAMALPDGVTPLRIEVASGPHAPFVCVLAREGVWCTGSNRYGQLGDGLASHGETCGASGLADDCSSRPVQVSGIDTAPSDLALGRNHACALVGASRSLRCWGHANAGQLGVALDDGLTLEPIAPMGEDFQGFVQIGAGGYFTCGRTTDGEVRCWGSNRYGQLGDGLADHGTVCDITNRVQDDCSLEPVTVALPAGRRAVDLAVGYRHACAALDDGTVACWGDNDTFQLGNEMRSEQPMPTVRTLP